jgi:hypothetical protein
LDHSTVYQIDCWHATGTNKSISTFKEQTELNMTQYTLIPVNNKTKMYQYIILLMDPIMSQFNSFHIGRIELLKIKFFTYCILSIKILNISMFTFYIYILYTFQRSKLCLMMLEYEICLYIYIYCFTQYHHLQVNNNNMKKHSNNTINIEHYNSKMYKVHVYKNIKYV